MGAGEGISTFLPQEERQSGVHMLTRDRPAQAEPPSSDEKWERTLAGFHLSPVACLSQAPEDAHRTLGDLKPDAMATEGQSVRGKLASAELKGSWG